MYHLVTDETVILCMLLSYLRDVNGSQSDGLTTYFFDALEGITYQSVNHYLLFQSGKGREGRHSMYHLVTNEIAILGISMNHKVMD